MDLNSLYLIVELVHEYFPAFSGPGSWGILYLHCSLYRLSFKFQALELYH